MKCPFELPVEAKADNVAGFNIIDKTGYCVQWQSTKEQADYIVHVINSHKKLVEALEKYGDHEPGCIKGDACNCGFEQALEGEK